MRKKMGMVLWVLSWVAISRAAEPDTRDAEAQTENMGDLVGQNRDFAVALADMRVQLRQVMTRAARREKELQRQLDEKSEIINRLSEELDAIEAEEHDDDADTRRRSPKKYSVPRKQEDAKEVDCCEQTEKEEKKETEDSKAKENDCP